MAPVRLRHPKGIATIQVPFDNDSFTVQDLQQLVYSISDILPSRQLLKTGYPPRSLEVVPELPLASLGLSPSDQIIVVQKEGPSAPPSSISPATAPATTSPSVPTTSPPLPDSVPVNGSFLVHRIVPDDNSCLFSSVALIFKQDITKAPEMRKIAADAIRNDPVTFDQAILGLPPPAYVSKILSPKAWGGAIELTVLAKYFNTEITSVDVESGRMDRFEPGENSASSGNRCIVVYSGIHYDAATLAPTPDAPGEWHQTIFPIVSADAGGDPILIAAQSLASKLREKSAFTNTATFDLKCEDCGCGLKGEKEARQHAEATGHVNFGEYKGSA